MTRPGQPASYQATRGGSSWEKRRRPPGAATAHQLDRRAREVRKPTTVRTTRSPRTSRHADTLDLRDSVARRFSMVTGMSAATSSPTAGPGRQAVSRSSSPTAAADDNPAGVPQDFFDDSSPVQATATPSSPVFAGFSTPRSSRQPAQPEALEATSTATTPHRTPRLGPADLVTDFRATSTR